MLGYLLDDWRMLNAWRVTDSGELSWGREASTVKESSDGREIDCLDEHVVVLTGMKAKTRRNGGDLPI